MKIKKEKGKKLKAAHIVISTSFSMCVGYIKLVSGKKTDQKMPNTARDNEPFILVVLDQMIN